jgi:hypothetical protein
MDVTDDRTIPTDAEWAEASTELGPEAAGILSTEHWSLLSSRSLIWNEAMSRSTVFLSLDPPPELCSGVCRDGRSAL